MATINRENIGVLNDKITVTVKEEDYNPGFQKSLKQYSKDANIPGFRKGKVPTGLIKKMYGESIFPQEVLKSVEEGLNDYLKKEELDLFGQPVFQEDEKAPKVDVNQPGDYSFDFEVGLKPKLELSALEEKLQFTRYKVQPDEKEIEEEIKQLQERAATHEELDSIEEEENLIGIALRPASEEEEEAQEENEEHKDKFRLSYFSPKLQEELSGRKPGDSMTVQLDEAFEGDELDWLLKDMGVEKDAISEKQYLLTIDTVEKVVPRELNEDFFETVYPNGGITTEEDFREKITADLQTQWEHQTKHLLEHEIFEKLVSETEMALPVDFLKKQLQRENGKLKTEEEVEKEYPEFEKQTKWGLITSRIIEEEKLDADPEEVKDFLRQQILGYFQMSEVTEENEGMVNELTSRLMQEEGRIDEAYRTILTNKLFDWLIEKAKIEEKEISTEDFTKLQQEHNQQHHEH